MLNNSTLPRFGAICFALLLLVVWHCELRAQSPAENLPAKPATADELNQVELLKSYLRVREQLHAAELAIANNRLEAETTARTQAAAITEKLDAIKSALAVEREHLQAEALRAAAERERQQAETQRSNRTILWVASASGAVGLLAMFFTALFQWHALNRLGEISAQRPQLPGPGLPGLLPAETGALMGQTVALSNQRLLATIDRIEQRIFELEHTADQPARGAPRSEAASPGPAPVVPGHTAQITALLEKGRSLINTNKPSEAVTCYDEVLQLDANHPEALVKKGVALERLKQDQEAIRCYDRAIEVDGRMTLAYLYKGGVRNRQQRHEEALSCYEQALQAEEAAK
jgi:tetratricopeptide (TPR) repeat protein